MLRKLTKMYHDIRPRKIKKKDAQAFADRISGSFLFAQRIDFA